jgi:NADP-dependent 3-hydroxy acid dehydrogenase YdfG
MGNLAGKNTIITGAGTGIGRAIAASFAREDAYVTLIGRRLEKLEESAHGLADDRVRCVACDVSDRPAIFQAVEGAVAWQGPINILVNNAGTNSNPRSVADVAVDEWDRTVGVNLNGTFNAVRAALPGMRTTGNGLIINIASLAGVRPVQFAGAAYSASKSAIIALSHIINEEEAEYGIRASAVSPGEVDTPILDKRVVPVSAEHRARILIPEDIAVAVLMIATMPPRVCVSELVIKPVSQLF